MSRKLILSSALLMAGLLGSGPLEAASPYRPVRNAHWTRGAHWHNGQTSWHGGYAHVTWGRPLALIVPPTANMQTEYAWGVGRTRMAPIHHQYFRPVPATTAAGQLPFAPAWPQDTRQQGVYYIRGPW